VSTTLPNQTRSTSRPAMSSGRVMFSPAVSVGIRLKAWKMNPILSLRKRVSSRSESRVMSTSPMNTCPSVGVSSPARQCSRVDFPDPDAPMIAVNPPEAKSRVMPRSASTLASPTP
jgi:hypothetical protein